MSRFWAMSLITRWWPTSQATSSTSSAGRPRRSHAARADFLAFDLLIALALAGVVQQHGQIERAAVDDLREDLGRQRMLLAVAGRARSREIASTACRVCSSTVKWWYMLNCICATMRPNSGTKRPSTPASFISGSARPGCRGDVAMSRNAARASASLRHAGVMRRERRAARQAPRDGRRDRVGRRSRTGASDWPACRTRRARRY